MATTELARIYRLVDALEPADKRRVLEYIRDTLQEPDTKDVEQQGRGTLKGLAAYALKHPLPFDDPDLSAHTREFMQTEFVEYLERMNRDTDESSSG